METTNYRCPNCRNYLNVGENVVFQAKTQSGKQGLIMLHPELGNYSVLKHPQLKIAQGEKVEFFCPYCNIMLTSERNENLVKILMCCKDNKEWEVLFSKIAGEESTYMITGENVEYYGKDSGKYLDYLNLSSNK
ncbi:MAG: hypothetical protein K9I94_12460 [Bacteroidales bacterium]|nr:hypothetical protein [Bacteroidales bacterium]